MKKKLTASIVENLHPAAHKQTLYDTVAQYLALIVIPSGGKTWYYCRKMDGRLRSVRIGKASEIPLPQARAAAPRACAVMA